MSHTFTLFTDFSIYFLLVWIISKTLLNVTSICIASQIVVLSRTIIIKNNSSRHYVVILDFGMTTSGHRLKRRIMLTLELIQRIKKTGTKKKTFYF